MKTLGDGMAPIILFGGVSIKIANSRVAEWGPAAGALTEALKDNGITVAAFSTDDTATIHVEIGTK
jgi:hypothetical protein